MIRSVHNFKIELKMLSQCIGNFPGFILAQQSIVHKNAVQLIAYCLVQKAGDHG